MKMWEIREGYGSDSRKDTKIEEAYECGFEEGYEKAMEELEKKGRRSYKDDDSGYSRYRR